MAAQGDKLMAQVKDSNQNQFTASDGRQLTTSEFWRQKNYDEAMFKFEDDQYRFKKERFKLDLKRLDRGHESMDGGIMWKGRALILDSEVWLALWAESMERFEIVLDVCKQRGILCDTRMEYRPPVSLPRPYIQIQMNMSKYEKVWKEILDFALANVKVHVIDLRNA